MTNMAYRKCAGAVVFNKDGKVFVASRLGMTNAWQFPQGGIEKNETIEEAARRELFEETSISSVKLIHSEKQPIRYEFPKHIKNNFTKNGIHSDGQDIFFSLFYFEGKEQEINLETKEQEFDSYMWESFDFAVSQVVDFKKDVYTSIANKFAPIIDQYLKSLT